MVSNRIVGYSIDSRIESTLAVAGLGHTAARRSATVIETGFAWNYTTWLNLAFLALTAVLLARFVRTGGIPMLKMMGGAPPPSDQHAGHGHDH